MRSLNSRKRLGTIAVLLLAGLGCNVQKKGDQAAALAPSAGAIILFRILQGAAGGIIHPLAQAALLDIFPKEQHGKMLSIWAAATMAGPILGPPLGGIITDLSSWRWVFAINLPIGLIAIWLIRRVSYPTPREGAVSVDILSVVLLILGIGALQLGLQRSIGQSLHESEILIEYLITGHETLEDHLLKAPGCMSDIPSRRRDIDNRLRDVILDLERVAEVFGMRPNAAVVC